MDMLRGRGSGEVDGWVSDMVQLSHSCYPLGGKCVVTIAERLHEDLHNLC